jgi:S-(hydroxymethyl)glutathione dehydrogenase/alcohol dehydrogenase
MLNGELAYNFAATSVFCDVTVVAETQAVKIDPSVSLEAACLIGCGVLTGVGAVLNRARVVAGQTAAVFGVGGIGLNVIQGLRVAGASRIIAVDTLAAKEKIARDFGATDFVDASASSSVETIRALLPHSTDAVRGPADAGGVDWAFECVGHPSVLRDAVDVLDWGGNCVIIGVPGQDATLELRINALTHVDRGLLGCRYGSARPHDDIPLMVDLYQRGRLQLDELVTRRYPLEEFETAVADLRAGELARGVLLF